MKAKSASRSGSRGSRGANGAMSPERELPKNHGWSGIGWIGWMLELLPPL